MKLFTQAFALIALAALVCWRSMVHAQVQTGADVVLRTEVSHRQLQPAKG